MIRETFVSRFGGLLVRLRPGRYGQHELRGEVTVRFVAGRFEADPAVAAAMREHYLYGKEFWAESDLQKQATQAAQAAVAEEESEESKPGAEDRIEALYQKLVEAGVDPSELQTASGKISAAKVVRAAQKMGIN